MDFSQFEPKNSLIVTASRRQARYIREQYQQYQINLGNAVWQSLDILPWPAFLEQCWSLYSQNCADTLPVRLSKEQSQYLWQQMVLNSKYTDGLLNSQQTVKTSFEAWRMINQWQIDSLDFHHGDSDQEAFAEWYFEYRKQLSNKNWIDSFQVGTLIANNFDAIVNLLPDNISFYGFQQINPQQNHIIDSIKKHKSFSLLSAERSVVKKQTIKSAESSEQEFIAAIRWAAQRVESTPNKTVAILVPDLQQQRAKIERVIQRELYPESFIKGKKSYDWHDISASEELYRQPMVEVVLTWLILTDKSLTKEQLQTLLLSPYLYSSSDELWQATRLEIQVRKSNKSFYNVSSIKELCARNEITLSWFEVILNDKENIENNLRFIEFIRIVLTKLESLHWSGHEPLSSHEFQLQKQFLEAIKSSAKLNKVVGKNLSWSQALNVLKKYIQEQGFHQETPHAPIKIMGLLEAVAIQHDAVWVLSATDKNLPQKTNLNPFLSKALQLKHQLPGSSHEREIDYAQAILNSLLATDELIFSYPTHEGEQELLLSPLLKPLADNSGVQTVDFDNALPLFLHNWKTSQIETYKDDDGLALEADSYTAGGTGVLKAQAASPFDAYVRYRLNAYPLETDDLGISFMDRGNIFHKVMQMLWQHLKSQNNLLKHSESELSDLTNKVITHCLNNESKYLYLLNHKGFFATEKERLKKLVLSALDFDKERPPFEVIDTEAKRQIEVGGLRINITIDRIDQLSDGSLLIIDYKTGTPRLIDLLSDPIGEPQLLLYAISEHKEEHPVSGVLFYQAHLKGHKYLGFTEDSEMIDGVKALKDLDNNPYSSEFKDAIEQWRKMLNGIAESFRKGEANLTEFGINYADHHSISRWLERDLEFETNLADAEKSQEAGA